MPRSAPQSRNGDSAARAVRNSKRRAGRRGPVRRVATRGEQKPDDHRERETEQHFMCMPQRTRQIRSVEPALRTGRPTARSTARRARWPADRRGESRASHSAKPVGRTCGGRGSSIRANCIGTSGRAANAQELTSSKSKTCTSPSPQSVAFRAISDLIVVKAVQAGSDIVSERDPRNFPMSIRVWRIVFGDASSTGPHLLACAESNDAATTSMQNKAPVCSSLTPCVADSVAAQDEAIPPSGKSIDGGARARVARPAMARAGKGTNNGYFPRIAGKPAALPLPPVGGLP